MPLWGQEDTFDNCKQLLLRELRKINKKEKRYETNSLESPSEIRRSNEQ